MTKSNDVEFFYEMSSRTPPPWIVTLFVPSLVACRVFRTCSESRGVIRFLARWVALVFFSSDVSPGVTFDGPIYIPHPTGIVIGSGVVLGSRSKIYQHVTLGSSRSGNYPKIGKEVTIFAGAVVAGGLVVGDGAIIGANAVVTRDVKPAGVVRSATPNED
jgi:serine O-acetyltransferase